MIGSNLLDNLDDKSMNAVNGDNSGKVTPPVDNSIQNFSETVPPMGTTTPKNAPFADMSNNTITENIPVSGSSDSTPPASSFKPAGFGKPPIANNAYDSYVKSSTKKDIVSESTDVVKMEKKLPFDIDVVKLKAFALNFIVPIVGLSVSLLLIITVIIPSFSTIPDLKAELAQKQTLNSTLSKKLSYLEKLLDFKRIVDENSTLINNVLVSEEMVPELLSQVDHIAKEANLEVTRLSYSLSQASGGSLGYPSVDVSLGVLGTYDQLVNFFRLTENASRLIDVSGYRYAVGSKDANALNINLVLRSPYLNVNSEAVTDDPIDLDVTSQAFLSFVSKIQGLKYYNPNELPAVETIEETQEGVDVTQEQNIPSAQ